MIKDTSADSHAANDHKQNDLSLGEKLRDTGIDSVESHNRPWVDRIREVAKTISGIQGFVSADHLREYADNWNDHPDHPNAWGSVFRESGWKVVGRKKSTAPSAHAREIKVWAWRKAA